MSLLAVKFRTAVIVPEKRPYTLYEIEVRASIMEMPWLLYKRYSDFYNLHCHLLKLIENDCIGLSIPPRRLIRSKAADVIARRKNELEIYLKKILSIDELLRNQLILDFLEIPESLQIMLKASYTSNQPQSIKMSTMSIEEQLKYEINLLLKKLSLQNFMVKDLHRFEKWYFETSANTKVLKPEIIHKSKHLIRKLFIGDEYHQGLIHSVRLLHSKVAWKASISLLCRLLDIERNNYAAIFQNIFLNLQHGIYKEMYLHQHINDSITQNHGFKIVQLIKNNISTLDIKCIISEDAALKKYKEWENKQKHEENININLLKEEIFGNKVKEIGYNWKEMGYKDISQCIFNSYRELSMESADEYQRVQTMSNRLKVAYKKDIDTEQWKMKIKFVVNHPPKNVYAFLMNDMINSDTSWNTKIIKQRKYKKLDKNHYIMHQIYGSFNSLYKFTDFVLLTCLKSDIKAKRYMMIFASIKNYDDLNQQKGNDRAILLPSGFEIYPLKDDANKSYVVYQVHMTNKSVLTVSADLLGETDELFQAILSIEQFISDQ